MSHFEELEKRLRAWNDWPNGPNWAAADAIGQLRQERDAARAVIAELKEALRPFAALAGPFVDNDADCAIGITKQHFAAARSALARLEKEPVNG